MPGTRLLARSLASIDAILANLICSSASAVPGARPSSLLLWRLENYFGQSTAK